MSSRKWFVLAETENVETFFSNFFFAIKGEKVKQKKILCHFSNELITQRDERYKNSESLTSMRILADSLMLYKLTTSPTNHDLTVKLIQHCTFSSRFPNKILFFDNSFKK